MPHGKLEGHLNMAISSATRLMRERPARGAPGRRKWGQDLARHVGTLAAANVKRSTLEKLLEHEPKLLEYVLTRRAQRSRQKVLSDQLLVGFRASLFLHVLVWRTCICAQCLT